ncbi:MAG: response regulator, partial [Dehalococcoidia bacterium]|nr:response regulator [Dehalococcoidia bacterium]
MLETQTIAVVGGSETAILCHVLVRKNLSVFPILDFGEALLPQLESIDLALLVLDLPLPGTGAEALCKAIRGNLHTRFVPVLVLSPTDKPGARVAAFQSGADDFLGKPFDPTELVVRVHALLRRAMLTRLLHPVSGLPTGVHFRHELESRVAWGKEGALMYCALGDFGGFNERYGFERGDLVLVLLAQILLETS